MVDESHYHQSRARINPSPCVFEKALLAGCAQCNLAQRHALAEREVVACRSDAARSDCVELQRLFRERATFALHLPSSGVAITHNLMMKLQCGGLLALQKCLANSASQSQTAIPARVGAGETARASIATVADVHSMLRQIDATAGGLLDLPWNQIVGSITVWQLRRRASSPKR